MTSRDGKLCGASRPRRLAKLIAALCALLCLALLLPGSLRAPEFTEAAWQQSDDTKGTFQTLTLAPIQDPKCLDHGTLSGLLNSQIRLTWGRPPGLHPDINVSYRITVVQGLLGGDRRTYDVDEPSFTYIWEPSGLLNLTINFSVSPFIKGWAGPATDGTALGVSLLGLGVELTCGLFPLLGSPPVAARADGSPPSATTSPSERTAASESTASAPPTLDELGKSITTNTTSTSAAALTSVPASPTTHSTILTPAAPAIARPKGPAILSETARLEVVDTITVGEEDLVVVEGDTVPADARQGAVALEIWLSGGDPGTTWATFASDDPDEDGWRWAAINQKTGTVVYIR